MTGLGDQVPSGLAMTLRRWRGRLGWVLVMVPLTLLFVWGLLTDRFVLAVLLVPFLIVYGVVGPGRMRGDRYPKTTQRPR